MFIKALNFSPDCRNGNLILLFSAPVHRPHDQVGLKMEAGMAKKGNKFGGTNYIDRNHMTADDLRILFCMVNYDDSDPNHLFILLPAPIGTVSIKEKLLVERAL